jgi:UDP-N-acetylglucosamine 4,6-dehydratase/5-epimerase
MNDLGNKSLLVTGGTGSFGRTVLKEFLNNGIGEIRIYSRDEDKQHELKKIFTDARINWIIGDVRDRVATQAAVRGVNYVFHAAALKQVPNCETHPSEAIKTNIIGTENVIDSAVQARCEKVICLSTDKAVMPVNAMGMSKALMEKIAISRSRNPMNSGTMIMCTRYGNVIASRGSVIPHFIQQFRQNKPITLTEPNMTRFLMTLGDAVNLVSHVFEHGSNGDLYVRKAPSASVETIAQAIADQLGENDFPIEIIGSRPGEKWHESLLSQEEYALAYDMGDYYRVSNDSQLKQHANHSDTLSKPGEDYSSGKQKLLSVVEVKALLLKSGCFDKIY